MGVIIALTLKEAMRRRAFLGTLIILVTLYGLSFCRARSKRRSAATNGSSSWA